MKAWGKFATGRHAEQYYGVRLINSALCGLCVILKKNKKGHHVMDCRDILNKSKELTIISDKDVGTRN